METQIHQKEALLSGIEQTFKDIKKTVIAIDAKKACQAQDGKWSIAQQLQHLILSNFPVASSLKQPYERLASFGTPTDSTLDFEGLKSLYYSHLAKGVKARGAFAPEVIKEEAWHSLFEDWDRIGLKFKERLASWPEEDLDKYVIPHPVLGPLSVRQMLFFTIFHNQHHLKGINKDLLRDS